MNKEKAEMTSKGDKDYSIHMEIKGTPNDILNILEEVVRSLMETGMSPLSIISAFVAGMEEKENEKSDC